MAICRNHLELKVSQTNQSLIRNSAYNLAGQLIPIVIGFVTIPALIRALGMDRFGLLSLLWVFLGYLTFFDLGLSRAIIKLGAELLAGRREEEVPQTVWTTLWITGALSMVGTLVLVFLSEFLVNHYFKVPADLEAEGQRALIVIAFSLPIVTLTSVLRGVLESQSNFYVVNVLQAISGTMTYLSPLLITFYTKQIDHVIIAISAVRFVLAIVHWVVCVKQMPALAKLRFPTKKSSVVLVHFGSWLTVSNIISPIMVYFDRFFLGSLIPVGELAYYTTPYEIITRVLILPTAVARTLFPAFSLTLSVDPEGAKDLLPKVIRLVAFIMAIVAGLFIAIAKPGLTLWLGPEFASNSTLLLQIFAMGIFFNAIANIPYTFLQSAGRPDLTAKLHLIELPIYLVALWFSARHFGAMGAAWAWSLRLIFDCLLLLYISELKTDRKLLKDLDLIKLVAPILLTWLFCHNDYGRASILAADSNIPWNGLIETLIVFLLLIAFYWSYYLRFDERVRILGYRKPNINKKPTKDHFGAVVVTFNPQTEFQENIAVIAAQFEKVCVVDNGSTNSAWLKEILCQFPNIIWLPNAANQGLGRALNQGMTHLGQLGFSWVATFDQDSLPSPTFLEDLKAIISKTKNPEQIGILAPTIFERNLGKSLSGSSEGLADFIVAVPTVITSGALTNVSAFEEVGRFEESFFIDYIDHNFAFRLRKRGFLVAECPSVKLLHRLGDSKAHHFLFKKFYSTHHSPLRRYYITRNRVQFYKEFFLIDPGWVLNDVSFLFKEVIKIFLAETHKWEKLKSISMGLYDGLLGRSGSFTERKAGPLW